MSAETAHAATLLCAAARNVLNAGPGLMSAAPLLESMRLLGWQASLYSSLEGWAAWFERNDSDSRDPLGGVRCPTLDEAIARNILAVLG